MLLRWIRSFFVNLELETLLFRGALFIAIPYFLSSITFNLLSRKEDLELFLAIDLSLLAAFVTMLVLSVKNWNQKLLINFFCLLLLAGFSLYWINSMGFEGGGTYIFPVISVLIILISRGIMSILFSIILIILAIILPTQLIEVYGEITYQDLLFDFTLNTIMFSLLMLIFKRSLDNERNKLENQKAELRDLNNTLSIRSTELELYNRDIDSIKRNLEVVAERHSSQLVKENEKIIEFAFINAHLVRAPLTNIMGLSELLETSKTERIIKDAKNLDKVIYKISSILHSK